VRHPALVVMGASWGGVDALRFLISALTPDFGAPLLVVQHQGEDSDDGLVKVLQNESLVEVREAVDKERMEAGKVYVAPAGYHLLVEGETLALSTEAPISRARPSIDALFESAAQAYGPRVLAAILTGTGKDGPSGAEKVKARGGLLVVQDPHTAENRGLPDAVLAQVTPDRILSLADIVPFLSRRVQELRTPAK